MKNKGKHMKSILAMLLTLLMLFGCLAPTCLAVSAAELGSEESDGGSGAESSFGGSYDAKWCVLTYDKDGVKITLNPTKEALSSISVSGLKKLLQEGIGAIMGAALEQFKEQTDFAPTPDGGEGDAAGINADNIWEQALTMFMNQQYVSPEGQAPYTDEEKYEMILSDLIAQDADMFAAFIDFACNLVNLAYSFGYITKEDLPDLSTQGQIDSIVEKLNNKLNDKIDELIPELIEDKVATVVDAYLAGTGFAAGTLEAEMLERVEAEIDEWIEEYITDNFADLIDEHYETLKGSYEDELTDHVVDRFIDMAEHGTTAFTGVYKAVAEFRDEFVHDRIAEYLAYMCGESGAMTDDEFNGIGGAESKYADYSALYHHIERAVVAHVRAHVAGEGDFDITDENRAQKKSGDFTTLLDKMVADEGFADRDAFVYGFVSEAIAELTHEDYLSMKSHISAEDKAEMVGKFSKADVIATIEDDATLKATVIDKLIADPDTKEKVVEKINGDATLRGKVNGLVDDYVDDLKQNKPDEYQDLINRGFESKFGEGTTVDSMEAGVAALIAAFAPEYEELRELLGNKAPEPSIAELVKNLTYVEMTPYKPWDTDYVLTSYPLIDVDNLKEGGFTGGLLDVAKELVKYVDVDGIYGVIDALPQIRDVANGVYAIEWDVAVGTSFGNVKLNFEIEIGEGSRGLVKRAAQILDEFFDYETEGEGGAMSFTFRLPTIATDILCAAANSDELSDELRMEIFDLLTGEHREIRAFVKNLSFDDLMEIVRAAKSAVADNVGLVATREEKIDEIIEKLEQYEDKYDSIKEKILPRLQQILDIITNVTGYDSLMDFYQGTTTDASGKVWGDLYLELHKSDIEAQLRSITPSYASEITAILSLIREEQVNFKVSMPGLAKITYKVDGKVVKEGLLPKGALIEKFVDMPTYGGCEVKGWYDENGRRVEKMTADELVVNAKMEFDEIGRAHV